MFLGWVQWGSVDFSMWYDFQSFCPAALKERKKKERHPNLLNHCSNESVSSQESMKFHLHSCELMLLLLLDTIYASTHLQWPLMLRSFRHRVIFTSCPLQVHVGTSHQEQRVVGYLTCTHLHAIEGTVTCSNSPSQFLPLIHIQYRSAPAQMNIF